MRGITVRKIKFCDIITVIDILGGGQPARKVMELTKEMIDDICAMVVIGLSYSQISEQLGIPETQLLQWLDFGEQLGEDNIYADLLLAIRKAEAERAIRLSEAVHATIRYGTYNKTQVKTIDADGKESVVITEEWTAPDADLALEMLSIIDPENWTKSNRLLIEFKNIPEDASSEDLIENLTEALKKM